MLSFLISKTNTKAMKRLFFILILLQTFLLFSFAVNAQNTDTAKLSARRDTAKTNALEDVTVTAFSLQGKWQDAPAAIAVINQKQLQLLNNVSLVPIFNTIAGVRMEERSPGSYRLSIRGSLLRSPFGVRNVKIYWNDIPLTDAGGNTYLNLVDISQVQSVEVIKGPASSLYGANTGGAVILHSGNYLPNNHSSASVQGGSYGLFDEWAKYSYSNAKFETGVQQVHQQSDGYRQQSAMRKDAIKWDGNWRISTKEKLNFIAVYSDLYYQTPGGLTLRQLYSDTTAYPKAVTQHNAIYNKTIFSGVSLTSNFSQHFDNITTVTGNHTSFINPFTTNYEIRNENNIGGRTTFSYHTETRTVAFKWLAGGEWLRNHSFIDDYDNNKGVQGAVQFKDELFATQYALFTQANFTLNNRLTIQAGASNNQQLIRYRRPADSLLRNFQNSNTNSLLTPRISVLYKVVKDINIYAVAARGFSPPTLAELHPSSTGIFNTTLQPEQGWNYEGGVKGSVINRHLLFDASAYFFGLKNAIVDRNAGSVSEHYTNAGNTKQHGIEVWLKGFIIANKNAFITSLSIANSFAYQPYKFTSYIIDNNNYSGNPLTGVPRTINVSTVEAMSKTGFYANVIFNNTSSLSVNDAATAFAKPYHLLQSKIGFQKSVHGVQYNVFVGGDNLLNETYSLGNDINAVGRRYYNPAPRRNYFVGVQLWL